MHGAVALVALNSSMILAPRAQNVGPARGAGARSDAPGRAQQWITSYASIYHRPGMPLFNLCRIGRVGTDARLLLS